MCAGTETCVHIATFNILLHISELVNVSSHAPPALTCLERLDNRHRRAGARDDDATTPFADVLEALCNDLTSTRESTDQLPST